MPRARTERADTLKPHDLDLTLREAPITPSTLNEDNRSVEATITTDEVTQVFDYHSRRIVDEVLRMDGVQIPDQTPLIENHSRWNLDNIVGSVRDLRVDGQRLMGRLYFAENDERADKDWNKVRQGHLRAVSVGYHVDESVIIEAGQEMKVGGREYEAGERALRVAIKWTPKETSLVPIGADANALIRSDPPQQEETQTMNPETAALETTEAPASASDGERAAPPVQPQQPAPKAPDIQAEREAAAAAAVKVERKRATDIRELAGDGIPTETVERAINEGWTVERTTAEFYRIVTESRTEAVRVEVGEHRPDGMRQAIVDAVGWDHSRAIPQDATAAEAAREFRGMGLQDIARASLQIEGRGGQAMTHNRVELFERALATGSFTELLGDSARKSLATAYKAVNATALRWTARRPVKDFLSHKEVTLSEFATMTKVGKGGKLTMAALAESAETYSADTYGHLFALDRQTFINDDLGAFLIIPLMFGRSVAETINKLVYDEMALNTNVGPTMAEDSEKLFSTAHSSANYQTGAGTVLAAAGLTAAKILLAKTKKLVAAGETQHLNISPRWLLVPPELIDTAMELTKSRDITLTGSTNAVRGAYNVHQGVAEPISEARLSAASTTAWDLIGDQDQFPTVALSFLNGREDPYIEDVQVAPDMLGRAWRVYHDMGVGMVNWRGIVRSKGA